MDAHRKGDGRWVLGFVLRHSDSRPVVVATRTVEAPDDPCMAEALGVKFALDWIEVNVWRSVIIESDAKKIVDGINKHSFSRIYWGRIGRCCLKKMRSLQNVSVNWISRNSNWATYAIAKWAEIEPNRDWICNFPTPIFTHIQKYMRFSPFS